MKQYTIPSDLKLVETAVQDMLNHLPDSASAWQLRLALTELLTNAILHGNDSDPTKQVAITLTKDQHWSSIRIVDERSSLTKKDLENAEMPPADATSGRGLAIAMSVLDNLSIVEGSVLIRVPIDQSAT